MVELVFGPQPSPGPANAVTRMLITMMMMTIMPMAQLYLWQRAKSLLRQVTLSSSRRQEATT